jgi:hypothetical protein
MKELVSLTLLSLGPIFKRAEYPALVFSTRKAVCRETKYFKRERFRSASTDTDSSTCPGVINSSQKAFCLLRAPFSTVVLISYHSASILIINRSPSFDCGICSYLIIKTMPRENQ